MITIRILDHATSFAENKDIAARIRETDLRTALAKGETVRFDFRGVDGATQSFIHALVSDVIRKEGASILDKIEFKGCNPTVRSVVEIVVEYSQLAEPGEKERSERPGR